MSDCGNVQTTFVNSEDEAVKEVIKKKQIKGVSITKKAAERIKHFCKVDGKSSDEYGLRVSVVTDGCSGKSYTMNLALISAPNEG